MAWSKIGYGTPEYAEYETLDHKLWDYGSSYSLNEYECVVTTALDLCTKYRLELKEVYEGYCVGKYDIQKLRETIARIDEQTKDGKFTEELLSELEKQQKT